MTEEKKLEIAQNDIREILKEETQEINKMFNRVEKACESYEHGEQLIQWCESVREKYNDIYECIKA